MRGFWGAIAAASALAICGTVNAAEGPAPTADLPEVPQIYEFVPDWPKPLPNNWTMPAVSGVFADQNDHIWVMARPDDETAGTTQPPVVLEFDTDGNLLNSWGTSASAPEGVWPRNPHTIFTDSEGNVWVGGSAPGDSVVKFTAEGEFIADFGARGPVVERQGMIQNNQTEVLMVGVAGAALDEEAGEVYIADGYLNRRIAVFDMNTGAFKRAWGAYGKPIAEISNEPQPEHDPNDLHAEDFTAPVHCVKLSNDGLVYVCDRAGDRVQVFTKEGEFVKEFHIVNTTMGNGSVGSIDFSSDPAQQHMFISDLANGTVWQVDRQTGDILGRISRMGPNPGEFARAHFATVDSQNNVYVGEIGDTGRVQKFAPAN